MTSLITDVGKDIGKDIIIKELWEPIKRHVSYFIHCKRYVKELKTCLEDLEWRKKDREEMTTQAIRGGKEPTEELKHWFEKAEQVEAENKRSAADVGEQKHCFTWLSELASRYRLGKEAVKKKAEVDELLQKKLENMFRSAPIPGIEELAAPGIRSFESTLLAANQIMDALGDPGIHMIGIHGMGGVGKTTLAKYVMIQVKEKSMFDEVVMVTVSQNQSVVRIQEEMAKSLGIDIKQEGTPAATLYGRIKRAGKILIILDDMWGRLELSEVGIPEDDERCKIILTSRSLEVCNSMRSQNTMRSQKSIPLGILSENDSWELFKEHTVVVETSIARNVASECGGLPLAIVAVARALIEKPQDVWKHVLCQLRKVVPDGIPEIEGVYNHLKVSYDLLGSKDAQLCFLLCSLFKEDTDIDIDDLTMYVMGEKLLKDVHTLQDVRIRVNFCVDKLKASSLLLKGNGGRLVKMHDVVRDVAIYIDKKEGRLSKVCSDNQCWNEVDDLNECRRLSVLGNYNNTIILPEEPQCSQIHTLVLDGIKNIPDNFFEKMTSLRVLHLKNLRMSRLPASMSHLTNLRTLLIDDCCDLNDISILEDQKNLEVLRLGNTTLKELPESIGKLINLKYLAPLSEGWIQHIRIPPKVIQKMSQLEEFHMSGYLAPWEVGGGEPWKWSPLDEIISLKKLVALTIRLGDLECLDATREIKFEGNLKRFSIQVSRNTSWDLEVSRLMHIELMGSHLPRWVIMLLGKTDALHLEGSICPHLNVMGCGGDFQCLKHLELSYCDEMEFVIHGSGVPSIILPDLRVLILRQMEKLIGICNSNPLHPGSLQKLRVLNDWYCPKFNINGLIKIANKNLEELCITGKDSIREVISNSDCIVTGEISVGVGEDFGHALLPSLKMLKLSDLSELMSIWKRGSMPPPVGSFSNLKTIKVHECNKMRHLLSLTLAQRLERLEVIDIWGCEGMEGLVSLEDDEEEGEPNSTSLSRSVVPPSPVFCNLRVLVISRCGGLFTLVSVGLAKGLVQLEKLKISKCHTMEVIILRGEEEVESDNLFPSLVEIELEGLPNLTSFFSDGGSLAPTSLSLSSLKHVEVKDCPQLKKLPLGPQSSPKLEWIKGNKEWLEGLVWDDENSRSRFQLLLEELSG
ncbi:Disease resistance protein [Acorus calamus]|uniref:Disease resistance protein n=1 Tax=Acorus calamus TaxID=4465 RepID=A0AAV9DU05_ACOCL|nr:Disease resistance protein [Acorus calamus]